MSDDAVNNGSVSSQFDDGIERACDRFEAEWKAGAQPVIEEYLAEVPEPAQDELARELLKLEIYYRRERGDTILPNDYTSRFPEQASLIEALLGNTPSSQAAPPPTGVDLDLPTGPDLNHQIPGATTVPELAGVNTATESGRVFGDYEILKELGKGGMGIVYLARQSSAERLVALKLIRMDRLEQLSAPQRQEWLDRFRTEGQAAARLRHENIVTVHEVGTVEGTPFYSMDYIEGHSLEAELREHPLPNARAAPLIEQVARAIHFAHERHILHRDLKPFNILVDGRDRPQVADFGLAKWTEAVEGPTHTGQLLGSPQYMSPEQAVDAASVKEASDVYSLGATLYALLTGRPPFQAATLAEILNQVRHEEPVAPRLLNPAIDRDLETIILQCLRKEPARRYPSALTLAEDLRAYRERRPITARPVRTWERAWLWGRRNPAVAASLVGFLLALTSGTAFSLYFGIDSANQAEKAQKKEADAIEAKNDLEKSTGELRKSYDELEKTLARSLLRPLSLEEWQPLTDVEVAALWELASNRSERLGPRFVAEALREPLTTRQLKSRADRALRAAVGLNSAKRAQVEQILAKRLLDPQLDDRQRIDTALVAATLGNLDAKVAAHSAQVLTQAMAKTWDPKGGQPSRDPELRDDLAKQLPAVTRYLSPTDAAKTADDFIQANMGSGLEAPALAQNLLALAARMEPQLAAEKLIRAVTRWTFLLPELTPGLLAALGQMEPRQAADTVFKALVEMGDSDGFAGLARIQAVVADRLEPNDASRLCVRGAETFIQAKSKYAGIGYTVAPALLPLATRLQPNDASRVANWILERIDKSLQSDRHALDVWAQGLSLVVDRLEAKDASRVSDGLAQALAKQEEPDHRRELAQHFSVVANCLGPKDHARLCNQVADALTQDFIIDPMSAKAISQVAHRLKPEKAAKIAELVIQRKLRATPSESLALQWMAQWMAAVAQGLEPKEAVRLRAEQADCLIRAMAKEFQPDALHKLAQELSELANHLEPNDASRCCAQATESLLQALRHPNFGRDPKLLQALSLVALRVEPKVAAVVGDTLIQNMTTPTDDPNLLNALVQTLLAVAQRVDTKDAARLCTRAADHLNQTMTRMASLKHTLHPPLMKVAQLLSLVASHLEPKETARACTQAADTLIQAMNNTAKKALNLDMLPELFEGLSVILTYLKPEEAQRFAAQATPFFLAVCRSPFLRASTLKISTLAPFLRREDVGQLTATLLREMEKPNSASAGLALGLWEVASCLEPVEAGRLKAKAATVLIRVPRPSAPLAPAEYHRLLIHSKRLDLHEHLEPKDAAQAAAGLNEVINKGNTEGYKWNRLMLAPTLAALAARLEPKNASLICAETAETLIEATSQESSQMAVELPQWLDSLLAVVAHLEPDAAARVAEALVRARVQIGSTLSPSHKFERDRVAAITKALTQGLSAVLTRVDHAEQSARTVTVVTCVGLMGGMGNIHGSLALMRPAVEPLSCRFSTPELVELLKQPTCVGSFQRTILDQLEIRYRMKFRDVWAFVHHAQEENLGLDFARPPKRLTLRADDQKRKLP